jgi:putative membrane protein
MGMKMDKKQENQQENANTQYNPVIDWLVRLAKGILVGIGAIVPGFSGGVLAVVFGIYEPMMRFLSNLRVKFIENFLFFLPVGIGGVVGVVAFSAVVDFAFSNYAAQFTWLFIGFIAGTLPSLVKTSGKEGRKAWHWLLLAGMAGLTFFYMRWIESIQNVTMSASIWSWLLSGILMGLGMVVPGMSPSNFLIYLGLYQPMASGIRQLDLAVILPIMAGVLLCILVFAKLVSMLFNKAYAIMYHLILGIVVGSTIAIIPSGVRGWTIIVCVLLFTGGALASYMLAKLDEKNPRESLF